MEKPGPYIADLRGHLKLTKSGEWWHEGRPFQNPRLAALFHKSIVWDEEKREYMVSIGRERAQFECEDAPYFVATLDDSQTPWRIRLLSGQEEALMVDSLRLGPDNQVYCSVLGGHRAILLRGAHQILAQYVTGENTLLVGDREIELGKE